MPLSYTYINEKMEIEVDDAFIKGEVIYFDDLSTIVVEIKDMTQDDNRSRYYSSPSVKKRLRWRWVMPSESCLPTSGVIEMTYLG